MAADSEMVTVYRNADEDAAEDAKAVKEILSAQGLDAVLLDDTAPGVPSGAWEVQVPTASSQMAEQLIAEARLPDEELTEVDDSSKLDVETVFRSHSGTGSEFEAMSVKSMLESAGLATVLVGDSVLPNLSFEVQVAREQAGEARELLEAAQNTGPQAAEDEERSTETPLNP